MAHSKIHFVNPTTGMKRTAPVGFSWTSFFWGPIPCLWRQDWVTGITILLLSIVLSIFGGNIVLWFLQGFFYNKYYVEKLVQQGYQVEFAEGHTLDQLEQDLGLRLTKA